MATIPLNTPFERYRRIVERCVLPLWGGVGLFYDCFQRSIYTRISLHYFARSRQTGRCKIHTSMKNVFLFSLLFTLPSLSFTQDRIYIERTDCFLDNCDLFKNQPNVEFGFLHVPEDYSDPDGRYIKIAFQVVKSTVANPEPDPILIFAGGWGMPLLGSMRYVNEMPVKNRDIILYDYRGTGYSTPALCDDLGQKQWEIAQKDLDYEAFHEQLSQAFYSCLESLKAAGIDYRHYGTASKTIDAVKLIEQLGYEEVNLFGISNGTMGIQGFIRAAKHSPIKIT